MGIKIERVTSSNKEVLNALNVLIPQMGSDSKLIYKKDLDRILDDKNINLLILKKGLSIVASATLAVVPTPSNVLGFVEDVVVDEDYRGNGYGKLLMQEVIDIAKKANVKQIKLQSNSKRVSANVLYKKLGFIAFDTNSYNYNID